MTSNLKFPSEAMYLLLGMTYKNYKNNATMEVALFFLQPFFWWGRGVDGVLRLLTKKYTSNASQLYLRKTTVKEQDSYPPILSYRLRKSYVTN